MTHYSHDSDAELIEHYAQESKSKSEMILLLYDALDELVRMYDHNGDIERDIEGDTPLRTVLNSPKFIAHMRAKQVKL